LVQRFLNRSTFRISWYSSIGMHVTMMVQDIAGCVLRSSTRFNPMMLVITKFELNKKNAIFKWRWMSSKVTASKHHLKE
ncbi:hypothetical protein, partial [Pusillimonas sp. T2]|uniref:hypothetical protein n=1 Tax=Pusillimonas sp. T2 TaxID=1548123 RepID=UPI001C1FD3A0